MRISKLFTLSSLALGFASALAIPVRRGTTRDEDLERRDNHPNHDKVSFEPKAMHHMQNILALKDHDGQVVEDYHKNAVAAAMEKHPGAHSAEIHYLAHTEGSTDPNMHITATFFNEKGAIVHSKYGTPEKTGERHHIYITGELPKEYTHAVQRHKEHLERDPAAKAKHEARLAQTKAEKGARDKARAEKKKAEEEASKKRAEAAGKAGKAKQHELSGDARAHADHRKASKEAKKSAKAAAAAAKKHPK